MDCRVIRRLISSLGLLFSCALMTSCEERRKEMDYRFNEKGEGWYFLIYEQPEAKKLPTLASRLQLEYPKGVRIVFTSTKPDFGWTKDRFFLNGKEVRSSELGGVHPSYYSTVAQGGRTLKYKKFYLGDFKKIDQYGDPDKILEELLNQSAAD